MSRVEGAGRALWLPFLHVPDHGSRRCHMQPPLRFARSRAWVLIPLVLCQLILATPDAASGQGTGTIQGQVTEVVSGRALPGAQLSIVGTSRSVAAAAQGRYTLTGVPSGQVTVRVQLIGFEALERTVSVATGQTVTLDFELGTRALAMDALVVTGIGQATERRQLTTSVAVISAQTIAEAPVQTLDQLLQGRVAGTTVSAISAQPGTGSLINFRGVSSVFGAQTPVIYVDGVRIDNSQSTAGGTGGEQSSALSEILTSDIERIEITRGGPASTLYGSDAATGVIQIFTRRGSPGAPRITARVEQGVDLPELRYILDAGRIYPGRVASGEAPANFLEQNFFRSGWFQNYTFGVSGGTDLATYSLTTRIQRSEGVQPDNHGTVYSTRGGMHASPTDRSRVSFSGSFTRSTFGRIFNGIAIADPITAMEVGDALFFTGAGTLQEALDVFLMPEIDETVNRFQFSTGYQWDHSEYFGLRLTVGADHRNNEQTQFQPIGFTPDQPTGQLFRFNRNFTSATFDGAATMSYPTEGDVRNTLSIGVQGFRDNTYTLFGQGRGFALPGSKDFSEAAAITAGEGRAQLFTGGLYFDENVALHDRVFLNVGMRLDAGTSFGDDVDYALYPKLGVAYDPSREPTLERYFQGPVLSSLRLRSAYGETGKFPPPFLRDPSFDAIPFRGESAPRFDNPGNEDLRPEVTGTLEFGFEAALWNDRVGIDFTWYDARTKDALFFVPEQPVTGQGTQIRNVGQITNTGFEVDMGVLVVNRPGLSWHMGATFQTVENEVQDMGGAADFFVGAQKRVSGGKKVGAWYVTTPYDTNGDGLNDGSRLEFAGCEFASHDECSGISPTPVRSGSFSTRLTLFQNLTLSALADWAGGHRVMDYGSVWATFNGIFRRELVEEGYEFPRRYSTEGQETGRYSQSTARSAFLYDGDWWKLREISARYTLPERFARTLGVQSGLVFGSLRNAHIWSANPLIDPELAGLVGDGLELGGDNSITISPPRSFRIGLEFVF